jgi:hypothetical protein
VGVPVTSGQGNARVVMLSDTYEHLGIARRCQARAAKAFVRRLARDAYYWAFEFC